MSLAFQPIRMSTFLTRQKHLFGNMQVTLVVWQWTMSSYLTVNLLHCVCTVQWWYGDGGVCGWTDQKEQHAVSNQWTEAQGKWHHSGRQGKWYNHAVEDQCIMFQGKQGCTYTTICLYCSYTKILAIRWTVLIPIFIAGCINLFDIIINGNRNRLLPEKLRCYCICAIIYYY